ncbi:MULTISPECIES: serine/threonine-protein kinase [Streptomyces]|uniref:non-specific serine/threonine protein kinase n=2 Tax=Streptomyces TaxID=1883 RepID=A0A7W3NRP5_STRMR|nr:MULTISPECIES: serine/threonine-protein kinase [Streptomyces]MBA9055458.1 tRNA A-37 threonylcarbamoyl transferase component Bud32 [Streptomyces murinus]UWW90040.1 protein kinase [Streptomyces murinus]WSI87251.1 serine/threonine protein kinase [Streptomyces murinus]WUD08900.1 serine/threonine protein kinase [Streptomyces murinus]
MQGLLIAGRYRLAESIGSGGMGRVWRAHDEVLHRAVAVKELTAALYVSDSDQAVLLARTRAEARAAARINHSAVVTVHDVLDHDGRPWIVMELVEGNSLADAVKEQGRIEPREAARIGLWVLRALRAAHSAGVLHRDVKPGNVLLGRDGRVLLTDFGIAQIEGDSTITRTGEVVGSVDYLAPERVRGHDPGPASDLWALGATLYTAVEGRSPFRRTSPLSTMQAVVEEEAEQPHNAGPLGPVISALLRKEPERRPGAEEAEQMLAEAAEGRRPNAAQAYVPTQTSGLHGPGDTGGYGTPGQTTNGRAVNGSATGVPATPGGPTAVGPTTVGPVPGGHGGGRPARPRRRLRTLALVVAAAAVLGGGAAVGFQEWNDARHDTAAHDGTNPGPASSASPGGDQDPDTGTVPDSWETHHDPLGFSISLPKGWKRQVYGINGPLKQIDYTPDGGKHFVRISIDTSPDFADAYEHQKDLEQQLQRLVGYQRVALKQNVYRDRNGSLWEYTWTALKKDPPYVAGPRHAVEETYFSREGTEYALYMSGPAADWPKTGKQFKWVLQSWQQPGQTR